MVGARDDVLEKFWKYCLVIIAAAVLVGAVNLIKYCVRKKDD